MDFLKSTAKHTQFWSVAETRDRALSFFTEVNFFRLTVLHARFQALQKTKTGLWILSREVDFKSLFAAAFLANGFYIVTYGGLKLTSPVL